MTDVLDRIADSIPSMRRYARALTYDADAADDLVQDCLERAIRKRHLWRPSGSLEAWLFKMLLNLYRNDMRRRKRQSHMLPADALSPEPYSPAEPPDRLALGETARAMERLPDEQRQALLLVALEGFSYAEAANILGLPLGTLMSRLGRARSTLRKLTQDPQGPRMRSVK